MFEADLSKDIVVVIDVLRATSNIVTMLDKGATRIVLFDDEKEALNHKLYYPNAVTCGERDCEKIKGFDIGNSPSETLNYKVGGREVAMTTTNGTSAMIKACDGKAAIVGSILNLTAVCEKVGKLARQTGANLTLLCSGWKGQVSLDDVYAAGAIINKSIMSGGIRGFEIDDGARIAKLVHGGFARPLDALLASISGANLQSLGKTSDIALCAKADLMKVVPIVRKDKDLFVVERSEDGQGAN